ncbi:ATP-binding protein [Paracoccus ravus]|uniref:ATP-binding protein n=1 Tax=Paracoccus ravus TaxID=2447760 RepID=UPI001ADC41CA|nr:ATP-binding protein [Paracoccus ravus]
MVEHVIRTLPEQCEHRHRFESIQATLISGRPENVGVIQDLATGIFVADQHNVVLFHGTGLRKTHLAIAFLH